MDTYPPAILRQEASAFLVSNLKQKNYVDKWTFLVCWVYWQYLIEQPCTTFPILYCLQFVSSVKINNYWLSSIYSLVQRTNSTWICCLLETKWLLCCGPLNGQTHFDRNSAESERSVVGWASTPLVSYIGNTTCFCKATLTKPSIPYSFCCWKLNYSFFQKTSKMLSSMMAKTEKTMILVWLYSW